MDNNGNPTWEYWLVIILAIGLLAAFWYGGIPQSERDKMLAGNVETQCHIPEMWAINNGNGTYTPVTNLSAICYYAPPDPAYTPVTLNVIVAGYEDHWFGDCTIATEDNQIYSSWLGDPNPCIFLSPGNRVAITIGRLESHSSTGEMKILSAKIISRGE